MSVFDISLHQPQKNNKYFLDCNILMYMFYPNGGYAANIICDYSILFTKIVKIKAQIIMTDVLFSEFINTYIQTEFHRLAALNGWSHSKVYFKRTFKLSAEYKDILRELRSIITRQIMSVFTMEDVQFSKFNIDNLFDNPETFDFNDRYYGSLMASKNTYIITHDADFSVVTKCNIITKNRSLLPV